MGEDFHAFSFPSSIISLRGYECPQIKAGKGKDRIGIFLFRL